RIKLEGEKTKFQNISLFILVIMYAVGVIIHSVKFFLPVVKVLTPFFLIAVFLVLISEEKISKKFFFWLLLSYLVTFFLEVIGVKTGLIFGSYEYGENLGLKILEVPFVIGINWISLMLGSIGIVSKLNYTKLLKSFFTGLLMVAFDLILEQVAPKLNYWYWQNDLIPLKNYISWFLISFFLSYLYFSLNITRKLILAKYNYLVQFIFFTLIFLLLK
ncbi:MAG: carotenoid biosynthesis protein, partial [Ignavibacterium sp.]|nr:carotenoid biosynthesis protein [Ignavibacterium sp.]